MIKVIVFEYGWSKIYCIKLWGYKVIVVVTVSSSYVLVRALPQVRYGNISTRGVVERLLQHKAKPSATFVSRPYPRAILHIT